MNLTRFSLMRRPLMLVAVLACLLTGILYACLLRVSCTTVSLSCTPAC